jgi:hypothetical protein
MLSDKDKITIGNAYAKAFGLELVRQGRSKKSGGLINSLHSKVTGVGVSIMGNYYWRFVDKGVKASQIKKPFAPPRINALIKWLKSKGIGSSNEIIRGIAYAIAYTHSKKGMPTQNGRRARHKMNFVDKALRKEKRTIEQTIDKVIGRNVETILKKL